MTWDVRFIDDDREAEGKPDPRHPAGVDVDLRQHVLQKACCRNVPYPALRCGFYEIVCRVCRFSGLVTVAGRADDPRTVTVPCKAKGLN